MADTDRIDDLAAWQLANEMKERVFDLLARTPAGKDFRFAGQVGEAASSIASNIGGLRDSMKRKARNQKNPRT